MRRESFGFMCIYIVLKGLWKGVQEERKRGGTADLYTCGRSVFRSVSGGNTRERASQTLWVKQSNTELR